MADLIIKPSSGNLVLKDDQDVARLTLATSTGNTTFTGATTLANATITTLRHAHFGFKAYVSGTVDIPNTTHTEASATDVTYEIVIGAGTDHSNAFAGAGTETIKIGRASDYIVNTFGTGSEVWAHTSDIRVKKDIKDNELGLDFINDLRTVTFKRKPPSDYPEEFEAHDASQTERSKPDFVSYGFIAQEVKEAMDKAGHSEFPVWSECKDGMQQLGEAELITPLIKAVQELSSQVKDLQQQLKEQS